VRPRPPRPLPASLAHTPPTPLPTPPINQKQNHHQVNLRELRKIAVVKGLGTNALRARAWPLLLGARASADDLDVLKSLSDESGGGSLEPRKPLHRDSAVVDVDVERSLWAFTRGWSDPARASARAALRRVINASVAEASRELLEGRGAGGGGEEGGGGAERIGDEEAAAAAAAEGLRQRRSRGAEASSSSSGKSKSGGETFPSPPASAPSSPSSSSSSTVHYYQGLHDVASVLLLVTGSEVAAFRLLRRLAGCQLRDFTRRTLDAALEACELLPLIVAKADPQLGRALDCSKNPGAPPSHYALPWLLTWFAHSASSISGVAVSSGNSRDGDNGDKSSEEASFAAASNDDTLNSAARLFDLFAASHPFMPLYVAAAAIVADKKRILGALSEGDPAEAHAALAKVRVLGVGEPEVAGLAAEAARLCRRHPPGDLAREAQRHSRAVASARSSTAALAKLGADGSWVVEDRIPSSKAKAKERGTKGKRGGGGGGKGDFSSSADFFLIQLRSQQKARGVAAVALAAGVAALALFAGGPASIGGGGGGGRG